LARRLEFGRLILHIATRAAWEHAGGTYEPAGLAAEGFIHFSTPAQVVRVAEERFRGVEDLVLLLVADDRLAAPVKYEGGFPHLYGPLNLDAVLAALPFREPFALPVGLAEITRENVRAVCELELAPGQETLVAPAAFTVAEGNYEPGALLRAITLGPVPVGVALVEVETGTPHLVRFMVDAAAQGAGIGTRALALLEDELRAHGWRELEVSFEPGARGFWARHGYGDHRKEL
jgi:diamine N-acetyltransferase